MRLITEEEWQAGIVYTMQIKWAYGRFSELTTEPDPYDFGYYDNTQLGLGLVVEKIGIGAAKKFISFDDYGGFVDYLGNLFPTRYLTKLYDGNNEDGSWRPGELYRQFNRASSKIAMQTRRGAGNKIYTGAQLCELPRLDYLNWFKDSPERIETVNWLPKNVALVMYVGDNPMDAGIHYYKDGSRYYVMENHNAKDYGIFLVWSDYAIDY